MYRSSVFLAVIAGVFFTMSKASADHASPSFETGAAGAILTVPGATLEQGDLVFGVGMQFIDMDKISDAELEALGAAEEDVHSTGSLLNASIHFAYGVTADLTLGASLPYVERSDIRAAHHHSGAGEVELAGDAAGMGDATLFGHYRFFRSDYADIAVIAGVKMPTGDSSEHENGGELFETEHQPGSGSWDPFAGLAFNRNYGRAGISANVLYTFTTEGDQQTELGDIFNYNLALSYRAWSPDESDHDHHHHQHVLNILDYVDLALELNGDVRERTEIDGEEEEHSGGHTLYISPGIRVGLGHRWSVYTSFGLPIINDYHGQQSEPDYRIIGGLSVTF